MIAFRTYTLGMSIANTFLSSSFSAVARTASFAQRSLGPVAIVLGLIAGAMMFASPSKLVIGLFAMAGAFALLALLGPKLAIGLTPLGGSLMIVGQGMLMISGAVAIVLGSVGLLTLAITDLFDSMTELAGTTGLANA
jgi:uncharacterized membrane protein YgdD (TMEM256/DUF423 family)